MNDVWSFLNQTSCYIIKPEKNTIITRCPFCGDSRKHLVNYGHLYISTEIPCFICFRCGEKGHISKLLDKYLEIGLIDNETYKSILQSYRYNKVKVRNTPVYKLIYRRFESKLNKNQLQYLKERCYKEYDWERLRVTSPNWLFSNTNILMFKSPIIRKVKQSYSFRKLIEQSYVAFVSLMKTVIILRNITNDLTYRYIQIYSDKPDPYDIYATVDTYDLYQAKRIIVAEGIFDILNARCSLNNEIHCRIAVFGKTRLFCVDKILSSYFMKPKEIFIYIDQDVMNQQSKLKQLKRKLYPSRVRFLYNSIGKDMGEPQVQLKELQI